MANCVVNATLDEIRKNVAYTDISISATDTSLELVPAVTGFIPVIVEEDLKFTGTWTVSLLDGATEISGAQTFYDQGVLRLNLGETYIKGSSGAALNGAFTKTSGTVTGRVGYVYELAR